MKIKEMDTRISAGRIYNLAALEARVNELADKIIRGEYVSQEEVLYAIGTKEAMQELERREKKEGQEVQEETR